MVIILESIAIVLLGIAIVNGLRVWNIHRKIRETFDGEDFVAGFKLIALDKPDERTDAWKAKNFILLTGSLILSVAGFCARLNWALHVDWALVGDAWGYTWSSIWIIIAIYLLFCQYIVHAALTTIRDWNGMQDGR